MEQVAGEQIAGGHVMGGTVAPGTALNNIYVVDERIAQGGMGEVYRGHNIQTGYKVAIKMILPEHAENELILGLFRREADTLHQLNHKAIVRYHLFTVDPVLARPYMVMEFAEGPSLGTFVREHGALSEQEIGTLRRRLASGLHAAHEAGVFHRDISPDNVILVGGAVAEAKLIDFGIAKSADANTTLIGSSLAGKMNYISPEQLGLNGGDVNARSDIYALGLVLAEAASGEALQMTGSHVDVIDKRRTVPDLGKVPQHIRPLIEHMLAPLPADRPADMGVIAAWGEQSLPPTPVAQAGNNRRVRKVLAGTAVAAGVAVAGVVAMHAQVDIPANFSLAVGGQAAGDGPSTPARRIVLEPLQEELIAPAAVQGKPYTWSNTPFAYSGAQSDLLIRTIGRVPPGLIFSRDAEGVTTVSGTPAEPGTYSFIVDGESPEGLVAEQTVSLNVTEN